MGYSKTVKRSYSWIRFFKKALFILGVFLIIVGFAVWGRDAVMVPGTWYTPEEFCAVHSSSWHVEYGFIFAGITAVLFSLFLYYVDLLGCLKGRLMRFSFLNAVLCAVVSIFFSYHASSQLLDVEYKKHEDRILARTEIGFTALQAQRLIEERNGDLGVVGHLVSYGEKGGWGRTVRPHLDPWGNPYHLDVCDYGVFSTLSIVSFGSDGIAGGRGEKADLFADLLVVKTIRGKQVIWDNRVYHSDTVLKGECFPVDI